MGARGIGLFRDFGNVQSRKHFRYQMLKWKQSQTIKVNAGDISVEWLHAAGGIRSKPGGLPVSVGTIREESEKFRTYIPYSCSAGYAVTLSTIDWMSVDLNRLSNEIQVCFIE